MSANATEIPDGEELNLFKRFMPSQQAEKEQEDAPERASKQQRTKEIVQKGGSGRHGKGKGSSRGPQQPAFRSRRSSDKQQGLSDQNLFLLCQMLIRLVLRQGDALRILALDTSLVLWLRTGLPAGVPEAMFTAAQKWKELREAGEVKASLRHILWLCLLTELEARTNPAKLTEETKTHLTKMGFIKDGQWLYLKWSFEENKLLTDPARSPISLEDAHQQVKDLLRMSQDPQVITRFHPTRPLAPELKSPTVTFMLSIALRSEQANELHSNLLRLAGNACTQVVGMTHRQERLSRSNLEKQLSKYLQTGDLAPLEEGSRPSITQMQAGFTPHPPAIPPHLHICRFCMAWTSNTFSVQSLSTVVTHAIPMQSYLPFFGLHAVRVNPHCPQD